MSQLRNVRAQEIAICSECHRPARYYHEAKTTTVKPGGVKIVTTALICDNCAIAALIEADGAANGIPHNGDSAASVAGTMAMGD